MTAAVAKACRSRGGAMPAALPPPRAEPGLRAPRWDSTQALPSRLSSRSSTHSGFDPRFCCLVAFTLSKGALRFVCSAHGRLRTGSMHLATRKCLRMIVLLPYSHSPCTMVS